MLLTWFYCSESRRILPSLDLVWTSVLMAGGPAAKSELNLFKDNQAQVGVHCGICLRRLNKAA